MSTTALDFDVSDTPARDEAEMSLNSVSATYGDGLVLSDVSLSIRRGEFLAVIGPSGGGKSTLLKCMNLIHPLTSGEIYYQCERIAAGGRVFVDVDKFRKKVGLVHQEWNLWPNKTVLSNLTEAPRYVAGMSRKEAIEMAGDWLGRFNIDHLRGRYPHELSGGQKQRVALARSLIMDPAILMMDEVTSALDVETTARLLRLFESLKDGKRTFIFVSHHLNFVERATDRTVVLIEGRVTEVGPSPKVITSPENQLTRQFLSTVHAAK